MMFGLEQIFETMREILIGLGLSITDNSWKLIYSLMPRVARSRFSTEERDKLIASPFTTDISFDYDLKLLSMTKATPNEVAVINKKVRGLIKRKLDILEYANYNSPLTKKFFKQLNIMCMDNYDDADNFLSYVLTM